MEYLNHVLGICVVYADSEITAVPNYIHARYRLQEVSLDGRKAVFVYPKTGLDSVNAIKKPFEKIQKAAKDDLMNPVKRTVYVPKVEIKEKLLLSGYAALSEYSMLNPSASCAWYVHAV